MNQSSLNSPLFNTQVYNQLLELDKEEPGFLTSIFSSYFEQVETTFTRMDEALREDDLSSLGKLGHFLKGSSISLGLHQVASTCEKIQHLGNLKDINGEVSPSVASERMHEAIRLVKLQFNEARGVLEKNSFILKNL